MRLMSGKSEKRKRNTGKLLRLSRRKAISFWVKTIAVGEGTRAQEQLSRCPKLLRTKTDH